MNVTAQFKKLLVCVNKTNGNKQYVDIHDARCWNEMFYLTTLNTFYLRLYGVGHMVKNHSDSERKPAAVVCIIRLGCV